MSLQPQQVNLILYQGIDTKTNSKLVEGKLLEMENCEINNQQIIKSPGAISLAPNQTSLSVQPDQKGIVTAYNTLVLADNNSLYKYNSDQDVLNKVENAVFSQNSEYNLSQNISETLNISGTTISQLYSPYSTLGSPYPANYCIPQPISAQYSIYLLSIIFQITGTGNTGNFQISLYSTATQTVLYQTVNLFLSETEIPQDAVGTPSGMFIYTIDLANGNVNEYLITYDLSITASTETNIFSLTPVLTIPRSTIANITNYVSFLSVEYSDQLLFFAFRTGTVGSYNGLVAIRDLGFSNLQGFPQVVATGLTFTTAFVSQTLCTHIFNHPIVQTNYFIAAFGTSFVIFDCLGHIVRSTFTAPSFGVDVSTHSMGFLQNNQNLVTLIHDIREFDGTSDTQNIIAPTVYQYTLVPASPGSTFLTATAQSAAFGYDPRWIPGMYGTSAIAGRLLCVYDKILFPIFWMPYLNGVDGSTPYITPNAIRRSSAHLVQFIPTINFPSPLAGLTNILNHVSWIKEYSCSFFNTAASSVPNPNRGIPPSILKSKITFITDSTQSSDVFYGFFVKAQQESTMGNVTFSHTFNAYHVVIPTNFDLQGFPRSSFYFGAGKMYELTQNTISEMGFFDFPQISQGATTSGSNLAAGSYAYAAYYEWTNGNGELVRSDDTEITFTITASASVDIFTTPPPFFSNKTNAITKIFRSTVNGSVLFFNNNIPITGSIPSYTDSSTDAMIQNNSIIYTNGGILGDYPFFSINSYTLFNNCIFAIDSNDNTRIRYSKQQTQGIALATASSFYYQIETVDGGVNFLAKMDNKLVHFKDNSIYVVEGTPPDDTGLNSTLTIPFFVTSPVGCNQPNSIVVFPDGIIFKSNKGLWQLDRSLNTHYIGADVEAYNNLTITTAQLLTDQNKVKFSSLEGTNLVYDYYYKTWNIETFPVGVLDSTIVDNALTSITSTGLILQEDNNINLRNNQNYRMRFTTGWIKLAGISGYQRVHKIMFTGDYIGSHILKVSLYFNYASNPTEFHYFNPTQNLGVFNSYGNVVQNWGDVTPYAGYADSNYLFRINVRNQKCVSMKMTIEDLFTGLPTQNGSSFSVTSLNFDCAVKSGTAKVAGRLTI